MIVIVIVHRFYTQGDLDFSTRFLSAIRRVCLSVWGRRRRWLWRYHAINAKRMKLKFTVIVEIAVYHAGTIWQILGYPSLDPIEEEDDDYKQTRRGFQKAKISYCSANDPTTTIHYSWNTYR